jgi:CheY-like chemotaxis protein
MDPSQIDQILANLAVNARDAISGVGQVTIETTNRVLDESYCARHIGAVPGEYAMIALSDNGSGMKKDVLEHAFEPFFTTKEIGKGTGLGLSTVYGIVSQNNGFIDVLSEPGKGTEIQIYLPRFESKADPTLRPAKTKIRGGKETILLVEDALPLLHLGEEMLADMGYTVLSASTPWQALDRTLKHVGDIHLLVTDVVMPEMNGRELAERLRELKPGIKCLYMSGYTTDVIASQGVLEEGLWFIQKPFNKQEFAARVRDVLDE